MPEIIKQGVGADLAVALYNPKFKHNVGQVVRAASCFGVPQVWWTGNRVTLEGGKGERRLPREVRMKGLGEVQMCHGDYFFDAFPSDVVPVAVEVRENAELLPNFIHPEKALYVFGPEDGSLTRPQLQHCQRFVSIPMRHCSNLASTVYMVLYDRMVKSGTYVTAGEIEGRGWDEMDNVHETVGVS